MSPIGEPWPDHPWAQRTGRLYFNDLGGDTFKNGDKIITGGKCFIKYCGRLQIGWKDGNPEYGPMIGWWEYIESPKSLQYAKRLD